MLLFYLVLMRNCVKLYDDLQNSYTGKQTVEDFEHSGDEKASYVIFVIKA